MRHTTEFNNYGANCIRTSFTELGIVNTYSVSIKHSIDADSLAMYLLKLSLTFPERYDHTSGPSISKVTLFDRDVTFKKVPYKQVRKKEYTQHFRYLKISVFTPYDYVINLTRVKLGDYDIIKSFISNNINTL